MRSWCYSPDEVITPNISNAPEWHTMVPDDLIRVKMANSQVSLEGKVDRAYQKEKACNAICNQKENKQLINK
jgi:osmotically-inducible protein OsmY